MRFVTSCIEDVLTEIGVALPVTQVKASEPAPITEVKYAGLPISSHACLTTFPGLFDGCTEYLIFACWVRLSLLPSKLSRQMSQKQTGLFNELSQSCNGVVYTVGLRQQLASQFRLVRRTLTPASGSLCVHGRDARRFAELQLRPTQHPSTPAPKIDSSDLINSIIRSMH